MEKKTILVHPVKGEVPFDPDHAKRLMSLPFNGGWEFKKNGRGTSVTKSADDTLSGTDKGAPTVSEEKGGD